MRPLVPWMLGSLLAGLVLGAGLGYGWFAFGEGWPGTAHDDEHDAESTAANEPPSQADQEEHAVVRLDAQEREEFGIEVAEAGPGSLQLTLRLTGEVVVNPDAVAHVSPRTPGVAREVFHSVGDQVEEGELLAVFDSRDLALAKAEFLATCERLELARANLEREEQLFEKKISSQIDYLAARKARAEAEIDQHSVEERLHALGISQEQVEALRTSHSGDHAEYDEEHEGDLLRYEMRAPIAGTIIEKHVTRGERFDGTVSAFVLADLSSVWVELAVYQKDLAAMRTGLEVLLSGGSGIPDVRAVVDYVSPVIDETTRSAVARLVVDNREGLWRPGLFVTGRTTVGRIAADVVLPRTAIQTLDGAPVVFVETREGFEPRPVDLGRSDRDQVEIRSGVWAGDRYVAAGAFTLKAELGRESLGHAGHAH